MIDRLIGLYIALSSAYFNQHRDGGLTIFVNPQIYNMLHEYALDSFVAALGQRCVYYNTPTGLLTFRMSDHVSGEILTSEYNELLYRDQ